MALFLDGLPARSESTVVRRLDPADLAGFLACRSDPEVARYQGWSPMTDAEARAFLVEMATIRAPVPGGWVQLGIAEAEGGALVGDIGLHLTSDEASAEIGCSLARRHQGRGHAVRALELVAALLFERTAVRRIRGITDARNLGSIRMLERTGFTRVGEQDAEFKGERCREFIYERSRDGA